MGGRVRGLQKTSRRSPPSEEEIIKDMATWNILKFIPSEPQAELIEALKTNDLAIFSGGNFTGKTMVAVYIAIGAALGIFKEWCPVPANIALVGLSVQQAREAFMPCLKLFIPSIMVMNSTKREGLLHIVELWNGSTIQVLTAGQGADLHQGARRSVIVYDEEPPQEIYEEGLFRLREDMETRIIFTMTPTHGASWVYHDLVKKPGEMKLYKVEASVFANSYVNCDVCKVTYMRCECPADKRKWVSPKCDLCNISRQEWDLILMGAGIHRNSDDWMSRNIIGVKEWSFSRRDAYCGYCWTYGHKPRIQENKIKTSINRVGNIKRLAMRLLGRWGVLDGGSVFHEGQIEALRKRAKPAKRKDGPMLVFQEPMPGRDYSVAIDPARGTGRDETAISVLDYDTCEQVATWGDNEAKFTSYMYDLIQIVNMYKNGKIWAEYTSGGEGLIPMLLRVPGLRFYEWRPANKKYNMRLNKDDAVGWKPGVRNQVRLLMQVIEAISRGLFQDMQGNWTVRENVPGALYVNDPKTIDQLSYLQYNDDKGKIMVPEGKKDDRIIALAGSWETRLSKNHYVSSQDEVGVPDKMEMFLDQLYEERQKEDPWGVS